MKESVYTYQAFGGKFKVDLEILLDINRELTEKDRDNLQECVARIVASLHEESINLDPASKQRAIEEKEEILSLFGDRVIFVKEIPNGYCSDYCCKHLPWFIVTTLRGDIRIGWRKRVIHIEWTDSIINQDAVTLFPNEDVTKYNRIIHAWGLEKAKEYIDVLLA